MWSKPFKCTGRYADFRPGRTRRLHTQYGCADDFVDRMFTRERLIQPSVTEITEHQPARARSTGPSCSTRSAAASSAGRSATTNRGIDRSNALGMGIDQRDAHSDDIVIHSGHVTQFTSWAFTERARRVPRSSLFRPSLRHSCCFRGRCGRRRVGSRAAARARQRSCRSRCTRRRQLRSRTTAGRLGRARRALTRPRAQPRRHGRCSP